MKRPIAFLVAVATLAAIATADYVKLKDGSRIEGQPTAYDEVNKVLSFRTKDGQDRQFTLDQLDARSVYLVNASNVPKDNYEGQLQVANFARDIGLYAHAGRHYRYAHDAGKNDEAFMKRLEADVALAKKEAGAWALEKAKGYLAEGNVKSGVRWLEIIIQKLPDEPAATEAQALLDQHYTESREKLSKGADATSRNLLENELKQGKRYYDQMLEKTKKGLTAKGTAATRQWNSAIIDGDRALREIDKFEKKANDPTLKETLDKYRDVVIKQIIDIRIDIASTYMTRSSYQQALAEVNKGLALDPNNASALAMRSRIENAAGTSGWGWRW